MALIPKMRFRFVYMTIFSILFLFAAFLGDPDNNIITDLPMGVGFVASMLIMLRAVLYVTLLHVSRRGLFDYVNLESFFRKSLETPLSASIALVAMSIMMLCITFLIYTAVK